MGVGVLGVWYSSGARVPVGRDEARGEGEQDLDLDYLFSRSNSRQPSLMRFMR